MRPRGPGNEDAPNIEYSPGKRRALGLTGKLETFFLGRTPYLTKRPKSVLFTLTNIGYLFKFLPAL